MTVIIVEVDLEGHFTICVLRRGGVHRRVQGTQVPPQGAELWLVRGLHGLIVDRIDLHGAAGPALHHTAVVRVVGVEARIARAQRAVTGHVILHPAQHVGLEGTQVASGGGTEGGGELQHIRVARGHIGGRRDGARVRARRHGKLPVRGVAGWIRHMQQAVACGGVVAAEFPTAEAAHLTRAATIQRDRRAAGRRRAFPMEAGLQNTVACVKAPGHLAERGRHGVRPLHTIRRGIVVEGKIGQV